ncbi:MAG: type II toxin-antitoxin system HicA family toxin [Armatimonadetes bacterium]|nr:type II toxin-antitoxin system HicA family toxin [Armatimonadota bacterium]
MSRWPATKLPHVSGEQILRALERLGCERGRQRGRHVGVRRYTEEQIFRSAIPLHDEVAPGTLARILRELQVSLQDLLRVL